MFILVLVSYLDKEGIWQAQILYVMIGIMMLWTIKFPTEVCGSVKQSSAQKAGI